MRPRLAAMLGVAALAAVYVAHVAHAQRIDPRRPASFVVGPPAGPSPMQRVDGRRSGMAKQALPGGALRVAWRKAIGSSIDQPALAGAGGSIAVVTTRGDVIFLDEAGEEEAHVAVGAGSVGPAVMTSDGTVVFATSGGDVVGVRRTNGALGYKGALSYKAAHQRPRFSTRIGGLWNNRAAPAPLALDDGGVVVASSSELVVLDAEGNVRARAALAEPVAAPLLASGDKVVAVGASGAVFGWTPGREPARLGSFGAPIDGGAAFADATTLLAVIETNHLVELDVARGVRSTRAIAAQGLYLGPPSVRPGPNGTSIATVLAVTSTRGFVVSVDGAGKEILRAPIETRMPLVLADGGPAPLVAPTQHVGPLVDSRGAVAFASTDGHVGAVAPEGAVETIADSPCSRAGKTAGSVAGLTPVGRGGFVVTCLDGGVVVRGAGPEAEPLRSRSAAPPRPSSSAPPRPPEPVDEGDDEDEPDVDDETP